MQLRRHSITCVRLMRRPRSARRQRTRWPYGASATWNTCQRGLTQPSHCDGPADQRGERQCHDADERGSSRGTATASPMASSRMKTHPLPSHAAHHKAPAQYRENHNLERLSLSVDIAPLVHTIGIGAAQAVADRCDRKVGSTRRTVTIPGPAGVSDLILTSQAG